MRRQGQFGRVASAGGHVGVCVCEGGGLVAAVLHEAGSFAKSIVQTPDTPVGLPPGDLLSPIQLIVCLNLSTRMRESNRSDRAFSGIEQCPSTLWKIPDFNREQQEARFRFFRPVFSSVSVRPGFRAQGVVSCLWMTVMKPG